MDLVVLGTGSADGWPAPGCGCAACLPAAERRASRAPTAALLDDVLLLDGGDDATRLAAAAGRSLTQVRHVLLSRPADDAAAPVGERRELGGHDVRVLDAGGGARHYDIGSLDGRRLLYAGTGGALPESTVTAVRDAAYDVVLLGLDAHLPTTLAALRGAGAVTDATDVVAVGLGHDPDHTRLARQLAAWGARTVDDGTVLPAQDARPPAPPRRTLLLGGARSGKSALAEQLLAAQPRVTYVATGGTREGDAEWAERVEAHRSRRPAGWRTVETAEVAALLRDAQEPLLVDCLGTWLADRLDAHGVWQGADPSAVAPDVDALVAAWRAAPVQVVAVSNEVGSGVVPATASGRLFRDLLGALNARVAAQSESVLLTVAGLVVPLHDRRA